MHFVFVSEVYFITKISQLNLVAVLAQWFRFSASGQKVITPNPNGASAGPLSKAFYPQLLGFMSELCAVSCFRSNQLPKKCMQMKLMVKTVLKKYYKKCRSC